MTSNGIHCRVFEGLCNRINCLASAMATGRPVYLRWAVNRHCPLRFDDIFNPIEGVKATSEAADDYPYEASPRRICWFYPKNVDGLVRPVFRERLFAAYRRIIGRLKAYPLAVQDRVSRASERDRHNLFQRLPQIEPVPDYPERPVMGIAYRHLLPGGDTFEHFWESVACLLPIVRPGAVFVACDNGQFKESLIDRLSALDVYVAASDCQLLTSDLTRTAESVVGMGLNLVSLSYCTGGIIASSTRSTVADSARGFGARVYYTIDSREYRFNGDDDLFEFRDVAELSFRTGTGRESGGRESCFGVGSERHGDRSLQNAAIKTPDPVLP